MRGVIRPVWHTLPAAWRTLPVTPRSWLRSATGRSRATWEAGPGGAPSVHPSSRAGRLRGCAVARAAHL